jgi:acetolactate synthase small subunit
MDQMFTLQELNVLREIINEYLTELRMEIADTDDFTFKKELKQKEEHLRAMLGKLEPVKVATIH